MYAAFLPGAGDAPTVSVRSDSAEPSPSREPLRILLIGSRKGITQIIQRLHILRFAEVGEWSPILPTGNPGELMSILIRHVLSESQTRANRNPLIPSFLSAPSVPIPGYELVKLILIGSRKAVTDTIEHLNRVDFAHSGAWSPLLPTENPGEVIAILTQLIPLN